MWGEFIVLRDPSVGEVMIIDFLLEGEASGKLLREQLLMLKVSDMTDGGMGSLRLVPSVTKERPRAFGRCAASCEFTDADGELVIASLYLDEEGNLFELDLWKIDFGQVIRIPTNPSDLRRLAI